MNKNRSKHNFRLLAIALLMLVNTVCCFSINAYAAADSSTVNTESSSDNAESILCSYLDGKRACAMTGTPQDGWIQEKVPNCSMAYYSTLTDEMLAMSQNKVDFFIIPTVNFRLVMEGYPDICQTDVVATEQGISYIMAKTDEGAALQKELNIYIQNLADSGELERLQQFWLFSDEEKSPVDIPATGEKGILKLAATSSLMPYVYKIGSEFAGFEIDILAAFCRENGYGLEISDMDFSGILSGVTSEKYDLGCSGISATEERRQSVYFCDYTYVQSFQFVMRADEVPEGVGIYFQAGNDGTLSLWDRLYNNFIAEDRWQLIIKGAIVTIGVTILSAIFGTLLGFVICSMRVSPNRFLSGFARLYIYIFSGMPQVLLLLIFCFIIFAKSNLDEFWIAVIAFSFNFSATVAELLRSGIELVDIGQTEAMLTLGYTKKTAFIKIVLPQGVQNSVSIYTSQLVSLLKATSVVGYIAVQDTTKVADIIRSRTFDAFIPLIFAGIVYFLLAALLIRLMRIITNVHINIQKDPRDKSMLKGVTINE